MKARTIVTVVLLLFVGVSVAYLIAREARDGGGAGGDEVGVPSRADRAAPIGTPSDRRARDAQNEKGAVDEVVVYYFHGNVRCATCRKIEAYAEEAVRTNFSSEMASGKVRWLAVNVDEPENAHFVEDYQLVTRSLVLVGRDDDVEKKWKNLDKIWDVVRSQSEFTDYVVKNTRDFMAGGDG